MSPTCAQHRVFGVVLLNDVTQILPRLTWLPLATKFETKLAITQLVWEISPRCLRLVGVFTIVPLNDVRQILPRLTLVAMATKFKTQSTITRLLQRNLRQNRQ